MPDTVVGLFRSGAEAMGRLRKPKEAGFTRSQTTFSKNQRYLGSVARY